MPSISSSEQEAWLLLRQGKEKGLTKLYDAYVADLYRYACRLTGDLEWARDAVQDLFVKLWQGRARLPEVDSPRYYLIVSLRNAAAQARQRTLNATTRERSFHDGHDCFVLSPEDLRVVREEQAHLKQTVADLLNDLSPRQREILYLRYYENLSLQEIADALSLSYQSVKNHIFRAYEALRRHSTLLKVTRTA